MSKRKIKHETELSSISTHVIIIGCYNNNKSIKHPLKELNMFIKKCTYIKAGFYNELK